MRTVHFTQDLFPVRVPTEKEGKLGDEIIDFESIGQKLGLV